MTIICYPAVRTLDYDYNFLVDVNQHVLLSVYRMAIGPVHHLCKQFLVLACIVGVTYLVESITALMSSMVATPTASVPVTGRVRNELQMKILMMSMLGTLCGSCRGDRGVSALLNRCVSCSSLSALLILALSEQKIVLVSW